MKYTPAQLDAITTRGKSVLVTASAGTGKTTVMIDRVASLIAEKAVSIDEIAVVTFTNLAASQMKRKLFEKLNKLSDDVYVRRQCENIDNAAISTIDSFCANLVRNYFYVVDIDPSFAIIDETSSAVYADRILSEVLTDFGKEDDEVYYKLYSAINNKRGDSQLKAELFNLYNFSRCTCDFNKWYEQMRQNYTLDEDSAFIQTLNDRYTFTVNEHAARLDNYAATFAKEGLPALAAYCNDIASSVRVAVNATFEVKMSNVASFKPPRKPHPAKLRVQSEGVSFTEEQLLEKINQVEAAKSAVGKFIDANFKGIASTDMTTHLANARDSLALADKTVEIINEYDKRYLQFKRDRSLLDFADLERLTLAILNDTTAVQELRSQYKMIFVDEYQDVNDVQEAIIERLTTIGNFFCVGDVKQSIYAFRQSDPTIFNDKTEAFDKSKDCITVMLNDNFRSDNRILRQVNALFSTCMTKRFGGVEYAKLPPLHSSINLFCTEPPFTLLQYEKESTPTGEAIGYLYGEGRGAAADAEAQAITLRIKSLLGTSRDFKEGDKIVRRNVGYGDITILCRDMKHRAVKIYKSLLAENIPVNATFEDKLNGKECVDLLNLLRAIDNPLNDIALIACALSCFGTFNQDELSTLALSGKGKWWERINNYSGDKGLEGKCRNFIELIEKYRRYSYCMTVDKLLAQVIEETDYELYVLSLSNGEIRRGKVNALLNDIRGKVYAQSINKCLTYLENYGKKDNLMEEGEGVTLTTIHKSKGLEYPLVIGAVLDKRFKRDESKICFNKKVGIAFETYDYDNMSVSPSLVSLGVRMANEKTKKEEELRLLYVLCTRAKNGITLMLPSDIKEEASAAECNSLAQWVSNYAKICGVDMLSTSSIHTEQFVAELPPQEEDATTLNADLAYVYPYLAARQTPLKVTASGIKRMMDKQEDEQEVSINAINISGDGEKAAEIGTAYHAVFEEISLNATNEDIASALAQLVGKGRVTASTAERIDINKIRAVLDNQQVQQLTKGEAYHEIPFIVELPLNELLANRESDNTVLQGVIDMLVIQGEQVNIIDFKYTSHADRIIQNYTPQMNAYKQAVKRILATDKVNCYIISVSNNEVIEIE